MFKLIYAIFFVLLTSSCAHQKIQSLRQPNNNDPIVCETLERIQTRWVRDSLQSEAAIAKYNELAEKYLVKKSSIGIIDISFGSNLDELENSKTIQFVEMSILGLPQIPNPKSGQYPHGYFVVNSMRSKYGLPISKNMTMNLYAMGSDINQSEVLKVSLIKACDDGNKVINISANPPGEMGDTVTEKLFEKELNTLNEKGCLVVGSAGNNGIKDPKLLLHADVNDSFLRVASHKGDGSESFFSNLGEVAAPEKLQIVDTNTTPGVCEGRTSIFEGTSASAPIVSVLASMIYSLLETQDSFLNKSGPDKVKTITEIIRLSGDGPENKNINSFKAMQLVESAIQNK